MWDLRAINREVVEQIKTDCPCADCGLCYPSFVMDFDHRADETKRRNIADMARSHCLDTLLREIEKCDVVCANCHRVRTHQEQFSSEAC